MTRHAEGTFDVKTTPMPPDDVTTGTPIGRFALDLIQRPAHLGGRVLVVVQVADECGYGALEVDVVFPEGIVGVDEEGLA